ncbi:MAG: MraY family glycosyltransferase [bacterium]
MIKYLLIFFSSLIISLLLTPLFLRLALNLKVVDYPGERKIHEVPIPYFGGIVIYLAFIIGMGFALWNNPSLIKEFKSQLLGLWVGGTFIFLLGMVDDIKQVPALLKLIFQILAALILFNYGFKISTITNPFGNPINLGILSLPITILWVVALTNAINLIDGLDGLAAGVVSIASLTLFLIAVGQQNLVISFMCIALTGSTLGFLKYNFHPAKIFMGDAGSMLLGFILSSIAIILEGTKISVTMTLLIPIIALGVPIFDTILVFIHRIIKEKIFFKPGQEHLHYRLLKIGLTHRQVILLIYFICVYLGMTAYILTVIPKEYTLLILVILGMGLFLGMKTLGFIEKRIRDRDL